MDRKKLGRHFSLFHRYKHIYISHHFNALGIGAGQYMYLLHLSEHQGISQKELSCHLRMDKATTTRAIKKLQASGLVKTECACHDKRQHELYITDKGKALLPDLEKIIEDFYELLFDGLTDKELSIYFEIGNRMEHNLCHAIESIKKERCCHED